MCANYWQMKWNGKVNEQRKKTTYINQSRIISIFDVVQNRCFVETRQFGHVFDFVKFWRIHFLYVIFKYHNFLSSFRKLHFDFIATFTFDAGSNESLEKISRKFFWLARISRISSLTIVALNVIIAFDHNKKEPFCNRCV